VAAQLRFERRRDSFGGFVLDAPGSCGGVPRGGAQLCSFEVAKNIVVRKASERSYSSSFSRRPPLDAARAARLNQL
jgi:hypothetical protein